MPSIKLSRIFQIAAASLLLSGCDPIPYADIQLAPSPNGAPIRGDSVAAVVERLLTRRGFVLASAPCFDSGVGFVREQIDSTVAPPASVLLQACVRPSARGQTIWISEARFGLHLLPQSTAVTEELADSLRRLGHVRIKRR